MPPPPPPNKLPAGDGWAVAHGRSGGRPVAWTVAAECAVAVVVNGTTHAVMIATPADLEDFAIGFLLAEGLIAAADVVETVRAEPHRLGLLLHVLLPPAALRRPVGAGRSGGGGWSGCGLCGADSLEAARRLPAPSTAMAASVPEVADLEMAASAAFAALAGHQPLNAATRSVHAAAWADPAGRIVLVREDVGRHTALDKLIGARARAGLERAPGFAVLTSRCGVELVQKAAAAGIAALACLSAPTALALETAAAAGLTLLARDGAGGDGGGGGVVVFAPSPPARPDARPDPDQGASAA